MIGRVRREFPDNGRGDFRIPAMHIKQAAGHTVSKFIYQSHDIVAGKPALPGLPSLFGTDDEVSTLIVHMYDNYSMIAADLSYSLFPKYDAIVRSVNLTNKGNGTISIEKLASLSVDLPYTDLDMIELKGDWGREGMRVKRKIEYGTQGFGSTTGYASHLHNPFLAITAPETTETHGDAWGFSLVYSGSFQVDVEKGSQGFTRAMLGLNPLQFSWPLKPGETFTTPECVAVYSNEGLGGMSRKFHRLYRTNLIKSSWVDKERPVLLNGWEALTFYFNQSTIYKLADEATELGVKLLVMDDGWFGEKYPRNCDCSGLGDWTPNPVKFPDGLTSLTANISQMTVANTTEKLKFGIWFEPEMVNPNSSLYREHPDWVLHAANLPRSETRNQLVLNLGLPEVQQFVIDSLSDILSTNNISYVKWDNNRGMHEMASPTAVHQYMLGIYHVFDVLTSRFPDILWEGCASGGGRFDPGVLQYFPQIWTSDNTDALDRIAIQFGTSLVYPASAMGAHTSNVPNWLTLRTTSMLFRSHVAMMGGSFGFELDPAELPTDIRGMIPSLVTLAEKVNPIIVKGEMYRLALPEVSNWPAAIFVSEEGDKAALFAFQMKSNPVHPWPFVRLQGLDEKATYVLSGNGTVGSSPNGTYTGATLMNQGVQFTFAGDYDSRVVLIDRA